MAFEQVEVITAFPLIQQLTANKVLAQEIVQILIQAIYLPYDYIVSRVRILLNLAIIYKNDLGREMYFIVEGTVHMLSPNEKQIIAELDQGSYCGEFAVYTTTKRMSSFVASTFCLV